MEEMNLLKKIFNHSSSDRMKFQEIVASGDSEMLEKMGMLCKEAGKFKGAFKYFEAAYKLGNSKATYELALMYDTGNSHIKQDVPKALEHYELAIKQGNHDAINTLGRKYYDNKEYAQAHKYFKQGYKLSIMWPTHNMGILYETGLFVEKDLIRACKYYIKAYKLGCTLSLDQIKKMEHTTLVNLFNYQTNKLQLIIDLKDKQIAELKLRPPELGGPEYEAAKTHFHHIGNVPS